MAFVVFYEKPGCSGNAAQKAALSKSGHVLEVRDLLAYPWTPADLRRFFGTRPVGEWFNTSAPAIRDGLIRPQDLGEAQALEMMCRTPILIRRPLMEAAGGVLCGFDPDEVHAWIGLDSPDPPAEGCPRRAASAAAPVCSPPKRGA